MNAIIIEKAARQALFDEYKLRKAFLKRDYPKFAFVGDATTEKTRQAHLKYGKKYYSSSNNRPGYRYQQAVKSRGLLVATRLAGANSEAVLYWKGVKQGVPSETIGVVKLSDIRETYMTKVDMNIAAELKIKIISGSGAGNLLFLLDKKEDVHLCIRLTTNSSYDLVLYVKKTGASAAAKAIIQFIEENHYSAGDYPEFTHETDALQNGYCLPLLYIGTKADVISNMDIVRLFDLDYILSYIQSSDNRISYRSSSTHKLSYANPTISKYTDVLYDALELFTTPIVLHFGKLAIHMFDTGPAKDLSTFVNQLIGSSKESREGFTTIFIDYKGKIMAPTRAQEVLEHVFRDKTLILSVADSLYPPNYNRFKPVIAKDVINSVSKILNIKGSTEETSWIINTAAKLREAKSEWS